MSHRRRNEEGSIAVMAAIIIPVVLLVIALSLTTLVWGASETEVQRSADRAALESASSSLLLDFPYVTVDPLSAEAYPTVASVVATVPLSAATTPACNAIGNPISAARAVLTTTGALVPTVPTVPVPPFDPVVDPHPGLAVGTVPTTTGTVTGTVTSTVNSALDSLDSAVASLPQETKDALASLPNNCAVPGIGPVSPIPNLPAALKKDACESAAENMSAQRAPYANNFFGGIGPVTATCSNGRVRVSLATASPLVGFGGTVASVGDTLNLTVPGELKATQTTLATLGVRLDTTLPNAICPQVSVEVDQPVKGPFGHTSTPNGRATARRVLKNAVVVPVFNGRHLESATAEAALSANGLASVYDTASGAVTTPAVNLNSLLLQRLQQDLLAALDDLDVSINEALTAANAGVTQLNGTYKAVSTTANDALPPPTTVVVPDPVNKTVTLPPPLPAVAGNIGQLDLLKCVRQSVSQLYDPPVGDAPTVEEVMKAAAASGEVLNIIQVGVQACDAATVATDALSCVKAAQGSTTPSLANIATGLYDVPFLDITPTVVRDIGDGNYQAVPVHTSQANGAFRATLVRSVDDSRYVR